MHVKRFCRAVFHGYVSYLIFAVWFTSGPAPGDEPARPTSSASFDDPSKPAPGHSVHGEAFDDGPRQHATLRPGMGAITFPVTTAKPEAQAFVSQGVAQLHSFYYFEAERSFRQAATLDPGCVMAYWGMAMANVNNPKRAQGFVGKARRLADGAKITQREQLYLDALSKLHGIGAEGPQKIGQKGLIEGLETIVQEFPDDLDARAWLALALYMSGDVGSHQAVDIVLDTVLRTEPMHPGAHHYRIHLWDHRKAARALGSAAAYANTAPSIAHAWHMPGHTYTELRRYADAAYHQEASARADHTAMTRDRTMPFEIHNYVHNNQWLATSLSHVGRANDAIAVARNLVELPRDPVKNGPNDGGSAQRTGRLRWAEIMLRYELWDDLIAATTAGDLDWSDVPFERLMRAYSLGLAYAARGDAAKLAEQVAELRTLAEKRKTEAQPKKLAYEIDPGGAVKLDQNSPWKQSAAKPKPAVDEPSKASAGATRVATPEIATPPVGSHGHADEVSVEAALAELEGYQLLQKEDFGAAFVKFSKASSMHPEARARAHLSIGNRGFALTTAKVGIERGPDQIPPLACYVEILHAIGKDHEAQEAYRKLDGLAKHADRNTPVFRRLKPIVASWEAYGKWTASLAEPATGESATNRVDLTTLGPLTWSPFPAESFVIPDTEGKPWALTDHRGKNVLVLFYLGGKCAHCMQQLQTFGKELEALKALHTEVVAVGTDGQEATKSLKINAEGVKFPMPLLADPELKVFKTYGAFNDFENQPLHGTILIDTEGNVRYQRISSDPFLDVEFIKAETKRVFELTQRRAMRVDKK